MGIRFRCPSGHKLHVKDFLAGKRGICPECGAKFRIPEQSEPDLVKDPKRSQQEEKLDTLPSVAESNPPLATSLETALGALPGKKENKLPKVIPSVDSGRLGGEPNPTDRMSQAGPTIVDVGPPTDLPSVESAEPKKPASAEGEPATLPQGIETPKQVSVEDEASESVLSVDQSIEEGSSAQDPISEAPHAVWYVRPPSGGQFGPASGDIMRSWMSEGRVTVDSLVWREGWPEWKPAGKTFSGLVGPTPNASIISEIPQIVTESTSGASMEMYRRRKSTKNTLSMVLLLGIACVVLAGFLFYVVKYWN